MLQDAFKVADLGNGDATGLDGKDDLFGLARLVVVEVEAAVDAAVAAATMNAVKPFHKTEYGAIVLGDSLEHMAGLRPGSLDLIVTSPPFGLVRKKDYGNVGSQDYVEWFKPFGEQFFRLLRPSGSVVIDIGGA